MSKRSSLLRQRHSLPCPQEYEQASKVDQFVTRFLLRETVNQLQALQTSLEGASDTLEAQARGQRYVRALLAVGVWVSFVSAFQTPQYPVPSSLLEATFLGGRHELLRGDQWFGLGFKDPGNLFCLT